MEIKVKAATGSQEKTTSEINLTADLKLPERVKTQIKNDVGEFLVESILSSAGNTKSPVAGESWPALSKEYKKKKIADGLPGKANLEFEGDLLDALTYKVTADGVEVGWWGDQAWKADGHAKLSGLENDTPKRRLIPDEGQEFVDSIQSKIESIVADAIANNMEFNAADFEAVNTKSELYDVLAEYFPDMGRADIRSVVTRTPDLAQLLDDMELLQLL